MEGTRQSWRKCARECIARAGSATASRGFAARCRHAPASPGHTLVELATVLAVLAVLGALAGPSWQRWIADTRQSAQLQQLQGMLAAARTVAAIQGRATAICPVAVGGDRCVASLDWSRGVLAFVNTDGDSPPVRDADEPVLRVTRGDPGLAVTANRSSLDLRSGGRSASAMTFVVCDAARRVPPATLIVSRTARARVDRVNAAGEVPQCEG